MSVLLNRNLAILFSCQLISVCSSIVMVTLGGIIGSELSGNPALATLPVSLVVIGTAVSAVPAALLMKAIGRRLGFSIAALVGSLAALLAAQALRADSFALFCTAMIMLGINLAFVQQYRFAAAESVPLDRVSRAIALVLLGSIGGAVFGPELATRGKDWVADTPYAGTMLALAALLFGASLLMLGLKDRHSLATHADETPARPLRTVVTQPVFIVAMMGGIVGQGVMAFIMTATPVSMHVIDGHSLAHTAEVVRSHVIAMYAPALVSGILIHRLGTRRMMVLGAVVMLATVLVGLQGHEVLHYWLALVLLGIGWNFLYVGGTTLLTRTYRSTERFKAQAVNDFGVFTISATASLMAGTVIHFLGWTPLVLMSLPPLAAMLLAVFLIRNHRTTLVRESAA